MTTENGRQPPIGADRIRQTATGRHRWIETTPRARSFVRCTCVGCGQEFGASRWHARWCSDACRKRAKR